MGRAAGRLLRRAALFALACAICAICVAGDGGRTQQWISRASIGLYPGAVAALERINDPSRKLLALRAYLRAGDSLVQRWSWSQEQFAAYETSAEGLAAQAEIDKVIAVFEAENPGCTLHVNRKPRTLDVQISRWNDNDTIAEVGAELEAALEREIGHSSDHATPAALKQFLIDWVPSVPAPLAAPGLSAHGQARAFDFQVERNGQIIAGAEFATADKLWDEAGWTKKLRDAVSAAGDRFEGPLQEPREPWHYTYTPAGATRPDPAAR